MREFRSILTPRTEGIMTRTETIHARIEELRGRQFKLCGFSYTAPEIREIDRELAELQRECELDGIPFPAPYAHHRARVQDALARQIALDAAARLERRHPVQWQDAGSWCEHPMIAGCGPVYGLPDLVMLGRLGVLQIHPDPGIHIPVRLFGSPWSEEILARTASRS